MNMDSSSHGNSGYRWRVLASDVTGDKRHQLNVLNSFTRKKEPFVSIARNSIKWYSCGPTVYDVAHLGHARCYITFDIIRRILIDYFGYRVFYVMNITDIDDKIIKRARSNHLCNKFIDEICSSNSTIGLDHLTTQLKEMIQGYETRRKDEKDEAKLSMIRSVISSSNEALGELSKFDNGCLRSNPALRALLERFRDVVADEQDVRLAHTVTDHTIFKELTRRFENEFFEDMKSLNIIPPNALTRVSEYIEEVGEYIKTLEKNGFAYRSEGSVYFDTTKFDSDPKHSYAKLVREAYGHKKSLDEGEGELAQLGQKRSPNDFALWKKSKVGEPSWQASDLDAGRPGWHIECSVMASALLGSNFDIHSGGYDLKFPHHDNEIAQAEAYYDTGKNWVNYFMHSGHLSIAGCKMSKSLKNFVTIRQALKDYTARQLRFAFLAHRWADSLDYSPDTMNTAIGYERTFREFFLNVVDSIRRGSVSSEVSTKIIDRFQKWKPEDCQLNSEFTVVIDTVDSMICDNFDTRSALLALAGLAKECNKRPDSNLLLLSEISLYINHILSIFGAQFKEALPISTFMDELNSSEATGDQSLETDENIFKFVNILAQFRADVRMLAKSEDGPTAIKGILSLCDNLRDQTLPNLGVRLEDRDSGDNPYAVKIVGTDVIAKERELTEKREQEKRIKDEAARLEKLRLQDQREAKMKIPPNEMFLGQTDKYSKFDDRGIPTHDSTGKEISKSALKKIQRLYAEQEVKYNKYISEQNKS